MRRVSHRDAVKSLIAPNDEVVIEVSHDPQPPGLQVSLALTYRVVCWPDCSSLDWVLPHWAHFTVLRFIFVLCITVCCMHA